MTIEDMKNDLFMNCRTHLCGECLLCMDEPTCPVYAERFKGYSLSEDEITRYYAKIHRLVSKPEPDAGQSAKADAGKLQITLVPRQIIRDIAAVRMYGNQKYPEGGVDNWKKVEPQRYRDALMRHLLADLDDPDSVDKESGIKHLKHAACNLAFLCEMEDK